MGSIRDQRLSDTARTVWAKTRTDAAADFELIGWLPLYQHLDDAAAVAGLLWDQWAPRSVQQTIGRAVGSASVARALVVWLAGVHDVGKASPAFAVQVPRLADAMREAGLACDPSIKDGEERRRVRHELVSHLAVKRWLMQQHGFDVATATAVASVTAAHHGRPAGADMLREAQDRPHLVGDGPWRGVRGEFLAAADTAFATPDVIRVWRETELSQPVLVLLSALVIVADWIASSDLFPAAPLGGPAESATSQRVADAWRTLDFPHRWSLHSDGEDAASLLASRFALPSGAVPHAAQAAFVDMARTIVEPELMILESEMGSGKTEAALLAAEVLAERFGMSGVFVGLPTQATADGMFSRVLAWADRLGLDTPSTVFLARSRASLNPEYSGKTREAYFRSMGDTYRKGRQASSTSPVIAHRWFSDPRRGPLSNFVVGTVDQALFAGLRSRYVMLRHLALASKVVIIDEVHAYDVYMREYFTRVLEWLGAYEVPVILLSATLPSTQRREFIQAYDRGRRARRGAASEPPEDDGPVPWGERASRRTQELAAASEPYAALDGEIGYPVVSRSSVAGRAVVVVPPSDSVERTVHLVRMDDDLPGLVEFLRSALRAGGCAAVIRNTVRRAQETVAAVREAFADGPDTEVLLAHSRFLGIDRATKDRTLLTKFGRGVAERPKRSIVVATQVIEQSLDVDFDLMVTDVAPIDLLLQRSGRLHRHAERDRPQPLRDARLVLIAEKWADVPPVFDRGTLVVYSEAILLRTVAALRDRDSVGLPRDIPSLVETVYGRGDEFVPAPWRPALDAATRTFQNRQAQKRHAAGAYRLGAVDTERQALIGWINGPDVDPETTAPGRATVRDTDETLEVVLLQRGADGMLTTPTWIGEGAGIQIPANEVPDARLTRTVLGCMLRLPAEMCRGNALDRHIEALERSFELPTWHASHALKGELVLVVDGDRHGRLNEFDVSYSPDDGFSFARRDA